MAVILALVGIDASRPINCQVGAVFCVYLVSQEPDVPKSQGLGHLNIREQAFQCVPVFDEIVPFTFFCVFLGFRPLDYFRFHIFDRASQVCLISRPLIPYHLELSDVDTNRACQHRYLG
jgi:hypothetical protein